MSRKVSALSTILCKLTCISVDANPLTGGRWSRCAGLLQVAAVVLEHGELRTDSTADVRAAWARADERRRLFRRRHANAPGAIVRSRTCLSTASCAPTRPYGWQDNRARSVAIERRASCEVARRSGRQQARPPLRNAVLGHRGDRAKRLPPFAEIWIGLRHSHGAAESAHARPHRTSGAIGRA